MQGLNCKKLIFQGLNLEILNSVETKLQKKNPKGTSTLGPAFNLLEKAWIRDELDLNRGSHTGRENPHFMPSFDTSGSRCWGKIWGRAGYSIVNIRQSSKINNLATIGISSRRSSSRIFWICGFFLVVLRWWDQIWAG